jgi:TDG/mug DNA glycosylase family protein
MKSTEILPDLVRPGLNVIFCGTAVGRVSALRGAYYAGPGNRFWSILAETGLTPRLLKPEEFRLLPIFGIGLTDLAKLVSGTDNTLPAGSFDTGRLESVIQEAKPGWLAFNGKEAAAAFLKIQSRYLSYKRYELSTVGVSKHDQRTR